MTNYGNTLETLQPSLDISVSYIPIQHMKAKYGVPLGVMIS